VTLTLKITLVQAVRLNVVPGLGTGVCSILVPQSQPKLLVETADQIFGNVCS
jgi:hypothetical protein